MGAVKMIAILIIVLILAGGLWHVSNLKANLAISKANSAKLEEGIKEQQNTIENLETRIKNNNIWLIKCKKMLQ